MLAAVIGFLSKLGGFILDAIPTIAAFFAGQLKQQNEQLEAENAIKDKALESDKTVANISDSDVLNELRNDADKPRARDKLGRYR